VTERAGVAIVGGGVMGASIAYHLALRGVRDVMVLEKGVVASGATGRSSACVRQHYSTPQTCRMALEALRFFEQAGERLGGREVGFVRTGCLLVADARLEKEMAATVDLQRAVGIDTRLVSREEMAEIEPRVATGDVATGCFEAASGYADPVATARAFAAAARDLGARIREETEVTGLAVQGSCVTGVETSRGRVEAPVVVNAAGLWSDRVARMAGVELPITVCRHKISIVAWPDGERRPHPMVYDFAGSIYTRPEAGGHILIGPLDDETPDRADPDRYREGVSFEESLEALGRAGRRFPVLERGAVARGYAGCFDVTPDWHPVIDQVGPAGFYAVAGFSGHGFKLSPAVGRMAAALVAEGKRPGEDVDAFRLSRFAEGKPIRGTYGDWLMC
jgi:glycine/D-amino acid oxidase-like deaminating enzyme